MIGPTYAVVIPDFFSPAAKLPCFNMKNAIEPSSNDCNHVGVLMSLPAAFLRGGTSKGIFINRSVLPKDKTQWNRIFLGIMGSPDPDYGRQLNGMGGGISSLSKIVVVGPSAIDSADVEYTFVQVGIKDSTLDYSGNCGNLSSMVGVFAIDQGICAIPPLARTHATIRSFNTNTQKVIHTTFPISTSSRTPLLDLPETTLAGVPGTASTITLDFINPAGARTGKLLPTLSPIDTLQLPPNSNIPVTCIDATNPTVFVSHHDLITHCPHITSTTLDAHLNDTSPSKNISQILESLRQSAARRMGLDPHAQAQPKIAVLSHPNPLNGDGDVGVDIVIHALSMGAVHKAVPMTVGLGLGVAANVRGTVPWKMVGEVRKDRTEKSLLRIRHPSGVVDVGAEFEGTSVKSAKVVRTGRWLMKGLVWW
jgi:2-methylaconitate cis-trans-isomerase PrpF